VGRHQTGHGSLGVARTRAALIRSRWPAAVALATLAALSAGRAGADAGDHAALVYRIEVDGAISPAVDDFIASAIARAHTDRAAALVIALDTPGGLLNSTKTIVKGILASPVPVVVYVSPGGAAATSAGVFITMAAHVAAMAPGTTIGAAHPVSGGGETIEGDMREKVENFAVSFAESIAKQRGRNVEWAAKAVRESVSVADTEAAAKHVVDFVAADLAEVLRKANGREVDVAGGKTRLRFDDVFDGDGHPRVVDLQMTFRQKVLRVVSDPNVAYLLMMAGMLGLYFEFSNPGVVFPGVAGAICLLLALLAGQVLPISSTGVLLIVLGMAFLVAELFLPSFGVLGVGGIVALTLGSLFLYTRESDLQVDRSLIATTVAVFSTIMLVVVALLWKDRKVRASTGAEGMVNEVGVAITDVHETGKVKVHGELWNASSASRIAASKRVRVDAVHGLTLAVHEEKE
jgi:membrane-bound serine protease (ClpP class)